MVERLQYPLTAAAAKRAEKSQWAIGDALLEEIGPPRVGAKQEAAFKACAAELAENGMPYSTKYLQTLRNVAHRFNLEGRPSGLSTEVAIAAGTPAVLEKAVDLAGEEGVPVTKRFVGKVRKVTKKQERKAKAQPEMPKRDKSRVKPKAETALRREINLSDLETKAMQAKRLGRQFAELIAGIELTASETDDLREDIDGVLATWEAVRGVVDNPLSREAEDYLKAVS